MIAWRILCGADEVSKVGIQSYVVRRAQARTWNLRADNGQNECTPRQVAAAVLRVRRLARQDVVVPYIAVRIAVPRTRASAVRACNDCHSDESSHEREIQQYQQPAQPFRRSTFLEQRNEHCDEGVEDGGSEDAFNGAIRSGDAALGLEAVDQTVHFVNTGGEDAERDSGGDELEDAREAEEPAVEGRVLERFGDEAREEASVAGRGGGRGHAVCVTASHV